MSGTGLLRNPSLFILKSHDNLDISIGNKALSEAIDLVKLWHYLIRHKLTRSIASLKALLPMLMSRLHDMGAEAFCRTTSIDEYLPGGDQLLSRDDEVLGVQSIDDLAQDRFKSARDVVSQGLQRANGTSQVGKDCPHCDVVRIFLSFESWTSHR
jgi:hypothetical protein